MARVEPMLLAELVRGLFDEPDAHALEVPGTDISTDSRSIARGGLFLACRGLSSHGLDYLDDAIEAGCAAVAWEPVSDRAAPTLPQAVAGLAVPGLSGLLGELSDRFFAAPGFHLMVGWYAAQRFLWEFLKPYGTVLGPFNLFHLVCAALIVYAGWMISQRQDVRA